MGDIEKKMSCYFLMHDEEPNGESFLRMAHKLRELDFDDNNFHRVMILTPKQMSHFLSWMANNGNPAPSAGKFQTWVFAGFMLRTLYGKIE
jgi:hypothetical protein